MAAPGIRIRLLLNIARKINRLFNQNFAAARLKWSPSLFILRNLIYTSDAYALFLKNNEAVPQVKKYLI